MKVLIIHQYFKTPETGGALRSYYLARALVEAGIETVVITSHNDAATVKKIIEGIEVHYLPVVYDNRFGFIKRVRSFLKFVWSIVKEAGKFKHVDYCYAISTPLTTGIAALWIKRRYNIPYIFEVGDLWPEAPIQLGIIRNPLLKSFLRWLERKIYAAANSIVALSDPIKSAIQYSVKEQKVHVIPNMADTEFFFPVRKPDSLMKHFGVKDQFVVSYIGTFGLANGLEQMLACSAQATKAKQPIKFLLVGEGAMLGKLQRIVSREALQNVMFIPFQNRAGVRDVLSVTDAVFISFQDKPVLETGSPNKYFDGLAAGKLVITNFGGWVKEEIESRACGFCVRDPLHFPEQISQYIVDSNLLKAASANARKLADEKYSREILSAQFVSLFRQGSTNDS